MKEITAALAGNPNVGKSTVFNALTGLHQHTGNWPGKTVTSAEGGFRVGDTAVRLVDLPGTYSLSADSPEEEIARDYLLSGAADVTVAVADATCLARNLSLVLQIRQITPRLVLCVNLLDEAEKEGVETDLSALSQRLSCPVIGTAARSGRGLSALAAALVEEAARPETPDSWRIDYPEPVEAALSKLPCPRHRGLLLLCEAAPVRGGVRSGPGPADLRLSHGPPSPGCRHRRPGPPGRSRGRRLPALAQAAPPAGPPPG